MYNYSWIFLYPLVQIYNQWWKFVIYLYTCMYISSMNTRCIHIYTYKYFFIYMYVCIYIFIYIYIHIYTTWINVSTKAITYDRRVYICIYICVFINMYECTYVCTWICIISKTSSMITRYIHVRTYMSICVWVYTHAYQYIFSSSVARYMYVYIQIDVSFCMHVSAKKYVHSYIHKYGKKIPHSKFILMFWLESTTAL